MAVLTPLLKELTDWTVKARLHAALPLLFPFLGAFFRSIALGQQDGASLQDILRLLTLWFRYGGSPQARRHPPSSSPPPAPPITRHLSFLAPWWLPQVDSAIRRGLGGDETSASAPIKTWLEVTP